MAYTHDQIFITTIALASMRCNGTTAGLGHLVVHVAWNALAQIPHQAGQAVTPLSCSRIQTI